MVVKDEQPVDDGTKGELCLGPGAGGMNPRQSEVKRALPTLHYTQEELLKKAKRYAMEQSVQQVYKYNHKGYSSHIWTSRGYCLSRECPSFGPWNFNNCKTNKYFLPTKV